LVTLAYRLDDGRLRRPDDFIAEIESQRVEDPTAARVRVMTVHQAKGLQFDIVVLPELDVPVKPQTPTVVTDRDAPLGRVCRVSRYVNETIQKLLPDNLQPMFARWSDALIGESLCVLYVAMTRAVHAIEMIIAPSKVNENKWPKTFTGVLRGALAPGQPAQSDAILFQHGDVEWLDERLRQLSVVSGQLSLWDVDGSRAPTDNGQRTTDNSAAAERLEIKLRAGGRRRRGLDYRTPSEFESAAKVDLSRRLRLEPVAAMTRGSILHAWFERIGWLDDGVPSDAELLRIAGKLATADIDLVAELRRFRRILAQPAVAAVLSKSSVSADESLGFPAKLDAELRRADVRMQLERERSVVVREDDALLSGAIDRLTLYSRDGRLIAADILDYKTDAVTTPSDIAERTATYRPQLAAYRRAMSSLTSLPVERVSARLLFVEAGAIVPITLDLWTFARGAVSMC
jgi:ATP-dependent exoDNAse (exonuclease V) beta subunit